MSAPPPFAPGTYEQLLDLLLAYPHGRPHKVDQCRCGGCRVFNRHGVSNATRVVIKFDGEQLVAVYVFASRHRCKPHACNTRYALCDTRHQGYVCESDDFAEQHPDIHELLTSATSPRRAIRDRDSAPGDQIERQAAPTTRRAVRGAPGRRGAHGRGG
jgi:hypothetical protein